MIHLTTADRLEAILEEGLRCGMPPSLMIDIVWTAPWYGTVPVFLGTPDADYISTVRESEAGLVAIDVDAEGLQLVADLPSLVDRGAHVDEGLLWWKAGREPALLLPYLDADGGIEIEHLLDPSTDACKAAIALTGTAACLSTVGPERLTVSHEARLKP